MNIGKEIKSLLKLIVVTSLVGCSGDPSISVLPSTDDFDQQGSEVTAKMDILWVIDNSGSMLPYQAELKDKFESFITNFVGKGYDYRMAVTTTDGWNTKDGDPPLRDPYDDLVFNNTSSLCDGGVGRDVTVSSKFLDGNFYDGLTGYPVLSSDAPLIDFSLTPLAEGDTDSTDDIETIFGANISQGACGGGLEGGLESMRTALDNPDNASYSFPRADAHLAVIVVSDEEDVQVDSFDPADYKTYLDGKAPFGWSFHTIAVLEGEKENVITPSPCFEGGVSTLFPAASETSRYPALSALGEGGLEKNIVASICSPFDETLQDIAQTIIETTVEFKLQGAPPENVNTIQVFVKLSGEAEFPTTPVANDPVNGWTYNESANSIVFHGTAIPAQGSSIRVIYDTGVLN